MSVLAFQLRRAACAAIFASLLLLVDSFDAAKDRADFLAPRSANVEKLGLPLSVVDCLDRELEVFQMESDFGSIDVAERRERYALFINGILPSCVETPEASGVRELQRKPLTSVRAKNSSPTAKKVRRNKDKNKQTPDPKPGKPGSKPHAKPEWEQDETAPDANDGNTPKYCRTCYSGCHWCCVQNGVEGFDMCWWLFCGGNGACW